ncbi:right-handed parallel beta-helix repeat-containing protein [Streptomyces stelliscabiei]
MIVTKGADPTIERCTGHLARRGGLLRVGGGRGSFLNCRVTGSGGYGFHVIDGCRATLRKCRTERCARGGYEFAEGGPATAGGGPVVEDCTSDESAGVRPRPRRRPPRRPRPVGRAAGLDPRSAHLRAAAGRRPSRHGARDTGAGLQGRAR